MSTEQANVVIIGGGPAGVAAGIELRKAGVDKVVLLDREPHLGGATRHCSHSPFGMLEFGRVYMGASYGKRLEAEASTHAIDVRLNHSVVKVHEDGRVDTTSPSGLKSFAADRILIATGARETPRSARMLTGDRPIGVITTGTLQSYIAFHGLMPFKRPLIVGSELVSLSALLSCLTHGARPVAMIEQRPHALAKAPLTWFPKLVGVPFHLGAEIVDIRGNGRVSSVVIRRGGREETLECDGVLLTGQFTPESTLYRMASMNVDPGSSGPCVDQSGRSINPIIFSAGNVLRGVETGGWSFREGKAVGAAIARDLKAEEKVGDPVRIEFDDPIKLVVPEMLRPAPIADAALKKLQLRFKSRVRGRVLLVVDGKTVWSAKKMWQPERRFLVPIPAQATTAKSIRLIFQGEE